MGNNAKNIQSKPKCTSDNSVGGILHVHPLSQCNLSCQHCYSDSSPRRNERIELDDIISLMESVREYGYNVLSVSGGEPFLYKELCPLLKKAKQFGMLTQLVTNGTLTDSIIAIDSFPYIDLIAISIDGDEAMHDMIRNKKGVYNKAIKCAKDVVDKGIRLGIVSAITNSSWKKMIEIADVAHSLGASLVQYHPLELSGRAVKEIPNGLSVEDFHKAYIVFNFLQEKYSGIMHIQMDCLHRLIIESNPKVCGYFGNTFVPTKTNFVKISNSIVLNENGEIMPFSYGLHNDYYIGNIKNKTYQEISKMFDTYLESKAVIFSNLISSSYKKYRNLTCDDDLIVWSEYIVEQSKLGKNA